MVNEVLNIDGNMWSLMERDQCLASPKTHAAFGKTIAEVIEKYGKEIQPSVVGNLSKDLEPVVYDGFAGIDCQESNIKFVGYNGGSKVMRVNFSNGGSYDYQDIPNHVWQKMLIADSKGKFLAKEIKGFFNYRKVN